MTTFNNQTARRAQPGHAFDLSPVARTLISLSCFTLCFFVVLALGRAAFGFAPDLHHYDKLPVWIHVACVVPAIPLGGYLLLARKGTKRHKQLGKFWLILMLATATSAIFIKSGGSFSPIHLLIPVTFHAAWKTVATARRGNIAGHKKHLVLTYVLALLAPGIIAFAVPGRLMNQMVFG
ncbi:DUF2306 domain-containing protein [Erythrobacter vulgaris]|uniref:DUF2306 domain-containing protein n=1 Tax=Qipengyuania vulgaris TaxID=291985 RepID=A0A844XT67_9SPHN|nr:DUF2306 domain-containing protein [Qipengyuania vulgaris]MXO48786.1 DUF2306 domain-containing protein [Qipengyuania vulgaris]